MSTLNKTTYACKMPVCYKNSFPYSLLISLISIIRFFNNFTLNFYITLSYLSLIVYDKYLTINVLSNKVMYETQKKPVKIQILVFQNQFRHSTKIFYINRQDFSHKGGLTKSFLIKKLLLTEFLRKLCCMCALILAP